MPRSRSSPCVGARISGARCACERLHGLGCPLRASLRVGDRPADGSVDVHQHVVAREHLDALQVVSLDLARDELFKLPVAVVE
eukprot:6183646-Pleurochrysis_carterae.AAC.2